MNIAICEDNAEENKVTHYSIKKFCNKNCFANKIYTFASGEKLLAAFTPGKFHLIFLDIYLTGMSGMETARIIRETDPNCLLIFITSSPDHALEAFSVHAGSYVLKPVDETKMEETLELCREKFIKYSRFIDVISNYQNVRLPLAGIQYVEVYGKTTLFHLKNNIFKTYMPLDEIEELLGGEPFLRCHRSYLVNMTYVADIVHNDFIMKNGDIVSIHKRGLTKVKLIFAQYMAQGF